MCVCYSIPYRIFLIHARLHTAKYNLSLLLSLSLSLPPLSPFIFIIIISLNIYECFLILSLLFFTVATGVGDIDRRYNRCHFFS